MNPSNAENLLALVERLREAGQRKWHVGLEWDPWENCPKHPEGCSNPDKPKSVCTCGADEHNAAVDAAAKALVEALKSLPEFDCGSCKRKACPHHGPFPKSPGPPHGCSAYIGGRT